MEGNQTVLSKAEKRLAWIVGIIVPVFSLWLAWWAAEAEADARVDVRVDEKFESLSDQLTDFRVETVQRLSIIETGQEAIKERLDRIEK